MLAFSGCYFGGGEKERSELGEIRKRWETLPVRISPLFSYPLLFLTSTRALITSEGFQSLNCSNKKWSNARKFSFLLVKPYIGVLMDRVFLEVTVSSIRF